MTAELYTIPISHYCERARFALELANIPFTEKAYIPVFHRIKSFRLGGRGSLPVLKTETDLLVDSGEIVEYAANNGGEQLYPTGESSKTEIKELEDYLSKQLGPAARRVAYFYVIPDSKLFMKLMRPGNTPLQFTALRFLRPLFTFIMRKAMRIDEAGYERSLKKLEEVFNKIDVQLGDSEYLFNDSFSAADLTFATLAAPVLSPTGHPHPGMSYELLGDGLKKVVDQYRATKAGRLGLRVYELHRETRNEGV